MNQHYQPPRWGQNPHVQSLLATFKLRRMFVEKRAQALLADTQEHILDCEDGVKLQGFYSHYADNAPLVILIHGWEGSADSMYLLSAAQSLYASGYSIFRLNLRDHGESHHLNEELFHSCRLQEVINATRKIQTLFPTENLYMAGFSLGGNFCLRVAAKAPENQINLQKVVAICPPIDPYDTMLQLREGPWIYDWYFQRKWKRSLRKKAALFPEKYDPETFEPIKDLGELTDLLLSEFGEFDSTREYFDGYALKEQCLTDLQVPSVMLLAEDDPIIRHQTAEMIQASNALKVIKTKFGGHCGYLKNNKLHSWADDLLVSEFRQDNLA